MVRGFAGWLFAGVLAAVSGGDAQDYDGPAPVNTTASVSAGADVDIRVPSGRETTVRTASLGNPLGSYAGVVPGRGSAPPVPTKADVPLITWPGFQMRPDGTSRVFVQSTSELTPLAMKTGAKFTVHLPGAKVSGTTNRLPLETRFFNTPVTRVNIETQRDGVTLVLDLRGDVTPTVSHEQGPTGFHFLYIDLPKGEYVKTAVSPVEAPPAPPSPRERAEQVSRDDAAEATVQGSVRTQADARVSGSSGEAKASGRIGAKGGIRLGR